MLDPRSWSRRTLVLLCLLTAMALPAVLSACSSDADSSCPEGETFVDGECVPVN